MVCGSVVRKSAVLCVVGEVVRCGVVSEGVCTVRSYDFVKCVKECYWSVICRIMGVAFFVK